MSLLSFLGDAATGGVFSAIGLGVQHFMDYKNKKLQLAHERAMVPLRLQEMTKESELAKVQGDMALRLEQERGANAGLVAALKAESAIVGTSQWVADLRGSVRPILTYALVGTTFYFIASTSTSPYISELITLTTAAVLFWFGDRMRRK